MWPFNHSIYIYIYIYLLSDIKAKERKMFRDAKHKEDMRTKKQINEEILLKVKQETEIMGAGPSMIEYILWVNII